jgi:hypothetical protein
MTGTELFDHVAEHEELVGMGILDTDKGPAVQVQHTPTGMTTQFPLEAIETLGWEELESVLTCKREPAVLHSISRVVGYFSRISNWNESKLGELKDRHKGTYTL